MNRQEHSDTYARENESRIAHREFLLQGVEKLTLFHDTFMKVVLNDIEVCQYVIRILMDDPTIEIVDVRNQYRLARLTSKDSILDIMAACATKCPERFILDIKNLSSHQMNH